MLPREIRAPRFLLRPWRPEDAAALQPILEANHAHLGPWIPRRVSTPVPVAELATRLAGFAAEFDADREWRYGMFAPNGTQIYGEVGLYPRSAVARVPYHASDRLELGYWLRADLTGRGLVTEASRLLLETAAGLERVSLFEARCDARNDASAAVVRRLGFVLETTILEPTDPGGAPSETQVWVAAPLSF